MVKACFGDVDPIMARNHLTEGYLYYFYVNNLVSTFLFCLVFLLSYTILKNISHVFYMFFSLF